MSRIILCWPLRAIQPLSPNSSNGTRHKPGPLRLIGTPLRRWLGGTIRRENHQ